MERKREEYAGKSSIMLSFATNNNNKVYYDLIILRESSHLFEYIHF